jgi:hypothetical protein
LIQSGFGSILYWIDSIRFSIDSIGIGLILSVFGSILCIRIYSIRFRIDSIGFGLIPSVLTDSIGFRSILSAFGSILSVSERAKEFAPCEVCMVPLLPHVNIEVDGVIVGVRT